MFAHVFDIAGMNLPAQRAGWAIRISNSKTSAKTTTKTV
jgi:hypothetical protein